MEDKGMERNSMIGMFLLMAMLMGYMFIQQQNEPKTPIAKKTEQPKAQTKPTNAQLLVSDSTNFQAKKFNIETEDLNISFNSIGGQIEQVELKKYKTFDSKKLVLFDAASQSQSFMVPSSGGEIDIRKINFDVANTSAKISGSDSLVIKMTGKLPSGQPVSQHYTLKGKGYEVDYALIQNTPKGNFTIGLNTKIKQTENDIEQNRKETKINFLKTDGETFDDLTATGEETENVAEPLKWVSFKQLYFNHGILAQSTDFSSAKLISKTDDKDPSYVKELSASIVAPATNNFTLKYYFGPNEFDQVKAAGIDYHKNVYLGYDLVKPINRFIFVPVFKFFEKFVSNYGLLILLVVLAIKLVLTPLVFKSYTSMAKMRVLAPEIEAIKAKVGDDQMKLQQEQMKLYQQVGVSPLSGCIPVLLQMPILMSVFFLFPNMIMFRQKEFLWSKDLSTYDAPLHWAQNLPIVGNHLSLFAILYLISTLVYTYYNNQTQPTQPGPVDMKKLSYIFPVVFFFVLNSFPAALNFYYFVSNIVTIVQQLIIKRFVDEDKIKAVLEENRKKFKANPTAAVKKNKFSSFLEKSMQAAEEAKKQQEQQKKGKK